MTLDRNRFLTALTAVTLAAGTALLGTSGAQAADVVDCQAFGAELRQLVNPTSEASLLTRWSSEAQSARDLYGFTEDLGVVARAASRPGEGLVPVWRLYRAGDFVWAADGADADDFVAGGYQRQFVEFYASPAPQSCLAALDRLERDGVHRLVPRAQAADLVADGWVEDGATFYLAADEGPANPPPPAPTTPSPTPTPPPDANDLTFSVAVIPDTQNEVTSSADTRFSARVAWLVDHRVDLDLRYAVQIGDLSNWGNVAPEQFQKASTEIKPLEAVVPWSVAAGNHDTAAVCVGGSACPGADASVTVRDVSAFNRYFPPSRFANLRGTFEPNKSENSYATFSAAGKEWLVLTLELWPRPAVVAWANGVVAANPTRNVIVNTHSYLASDGSISTSNGGYGATSPRYLFDNLIKLHPNITMVLSGHVGMAAVRTDTGVNGNKVVSFLQTFHSTTDPVRLIEINTGAGTVTSRVYAPESNTDFPQYSTSTTGMTFR